MVRTAGGDAILLPVQCLALELKTMPRKSAAELSVVPISRHLAKIKPPPGIAPPELALFQEIVSASPALAFTQSDARLLTAYVQSILLCQTAFDSAMASPVAVRGAPPA